MKRDNRLLQKRIKKVGFLFHLKKSEGISSKASLIETAEIFGISISQTEKDLARFNREIIGV